jgi:20S proteasome alpha/beta subunit
MTICIAAFCEGGKGLVLCGDKQLGVGFTSANFPSGKFGQIYDQWSIGLSGTIANALDVFDEAVRGRHKLSSFSSYEVRSAIELAYKRARLHQAEVKFLGNRGWTLNDFVDHGAAKLPPSTFANIDAQIATFDYNTDLIIAGWGNADAEWSVFTIANPGISTDHSKLGFWCIGSGAVAAQMALFARAYSPDFSIESAIYAVYEAKLHAERASGVGNTTDILLIKPGMQRMDAVGVWPGASQDILNGIWEKLKPRNFAQAELNAIKGFPEVARYRQFKPSSQA